MSMDENGLMELFRAYRRIYAEERAQLDEAHDLEGEHVNAMPASIRQAYLDFLDGLYCTDAIFDEQKSRLETQWNR